MPHATASAHCTNESIASFDPPSKKIVDRKYSIDMLYYMTTRRLRQLENQIQKIKDDLWQIGEMRPGSLTLQYKVPKEKKGPYYQLSYTHKMRSRTQYVRTEFVNETRQQIDVYKRFRKLIEKWIDLAIEHSQIKMKQAKRSKDDKKE
jgi:hypothetical protein